MWGFRSDLNKLKERPERMEALLVDLGERQLLIKDVELKWFDEVKKAAYEANDLLNEILYEHLRRKLEIKDRYYNKDRLRGRYFFFTCMSNRLGFQWRMAREVRKVMVKIDDVFDEGKRYGIQPINVGQTVSNDGGSLRTCGYFNGGWFEVRVELDQVAINKGRYQRLVGRLMYLVHTRPDLACALSMVNQFMHSSGEKHIPAVIRILRYLKGSPGRGLLLTKNDHLEIEVYTDVDWGDATDRGSTLGYFTFVEGNLVT